MRVLIIDDSECDRNVLSLELKALYPPMEIKGAANLHEARTALLSWLYDILFLDVRLGVDDGILFLDELRKSPHEWARKQKVIIHSGMPSPLDKAVSTELRADGYLDKTAVLGQFRDDLKRVVTPFLPKKIPQGQQV